MKINGSLGEEKVRDGLVSWFKTQWIWLMFFNLAGCQNQPPFQVPLRKKKNKTLQLLVPGIIKKRLRDFPWPLPPPPQKKKKVHRISYTTDCSRLYQWPWVRWPWNYIHYTHSLSLARKLKMMVSQKGISFSTGIHFQVNHARLLEGMVWCFCWKQSR